jgi:zearalenone synthase (highly reducing iterative type I polyketide synthase)
LLIHNNPSATVTELALDSEGLSQVTVPRLPKGTILSSQVDFAVASDISADLDKSLLFGSAFSLGPVGEALPTDFSPADVLVIPTSITTAKDAGGIVDRLAGLARPGAAVVVAVESKVVQSALENKGFSCVFAMDGAGLYEQKSENTNGVNGTAKRNFVIVEPPTLSIWAKSFSAALQKSLEGEDYEAAMISWKDLSIQSAADAEGKTFISLVELETPLLQHMSESDFDKVKKLISYGEQLLWITGSDDPSAFVVDGLSRTARNENASLNFQVLHLLSNANMLLQHGPTLAFRLATSHTKDSEFRVRDSLLEVSRFYHSVTGNESVRYCLEDSVSVQPLKNEDEDGSEALRLTIGKPGLLDSLAFIHDERFDTAMDDMEIEISVRATGIK